jgi:hypothetical protein
MPDGFPSTRSTGTGDIAKPSPKSSTAPSDPDRNEQRVLEEIVRLSSDAEKSRHERYLSMFQFIQWQDRELADASDELRLSTERATASLRGC